MLYFTPKCGVTKSSHSHELTRNRAGVVSIMLNVLEHKEDGDVAEVVEDTAFAGMLNQQRLLTFPNSFCFLYPGIH